MAKLFKGTIIQSIEVIGSMFGLIGNNNLMLGAGSYLAWKDRHGTFAVEMSLIFANGVFNFFFFFNQKFNRKLVGKANTQEPY